MARKRNAVELTVLRASCQHTNNVFENTVSCNTFSSKESPGACSARAKKVQVVACGMACVHKATLQQSCVVHL
eukprot:3581779-Amphidinium_carterae.1